MKDKDVIRRLFQYMGKFRTTMAISFIFAAASAIMNLLAFVCVHDVARAIVSSGGSFASLDRAYLVDTGWKAVMLIASAFGTYGMALVFSHITAFNTVAQIRIRLIGHIGNLPLGYHSNNPSGKVRKIIEKNTDNVEVIIAHRLPDFMQSITMPVAFLVFMFAYDWRLSIVCLIPIVSGFAILAWTLKDESEGIARQFQKSAEDINNAITEYIRGISVVKVFGQTARSFRRYENACEEYCDYMTRYALGMRMTDSAYNTIINSAPLFLLPAGIILFNLGQGTEKVILSFIFFSVLTPSIAVILTRIMKSSSDLMVGRASLEAIDAILSTEPLATCEHPHVPRTFDIRFDHVSFAYEDGAEKALDDVSFTVEQGTVTALVGESGGGKSTVANLIARFWDCDEGAVSIGGVDVRDMDYRAWMANISVVFQDTNLFKMSIIDNVSVFCPNASREEVLEALHLAQCDDILEKLPQGADTVIGAKGIYLSGGEMQRIALARAILKDAPVVLLDEATAFADAENEYLIQKAFDELLRGKTVIMIAHRLSTVVDADQICVLKGGKIIERGTHRDLMEAEGTYARMFREYQSSISWKIGGYQHA